MAHKFAELAFTPTVREMQSVLGSRSSYAAMDGGDDYNNQLTEREAMFISERDSCYVASVSETDWPYIQHRGGPVGFMKVLDANRIGFADYAGNKQYVSTGNFMNNNRVSLFFMDYPNRRRLKMLGRVEIVDSNDTSVINQLRDDAYRVQLERAFIIHVEAFDWNCPQHITRRYSEAEIESLSYSPTEPIDEDVELQRYSIEENSSNSDSTRQIIGSGPLQLEISGIRQLSPQIRSYELRGSNGDSLPEIQAGAHLRVPVQLASGKLEEREYSIASDPMQRDYYEIAVLREEQGRGGSKAVHDSFALGTVLNADMPVNHIFLHTDDRPALLIAGGIGITPMRSMALTLLRRGVNFELHYAGRSRRDLAFISSLEQQLGEKVVSYSADQGERLNVKKLLVELPKFGVLYVCGPPRLTDAVITEAKAQGISEERIRFEVFE